MACGSRPASQTRASICWVESALVVVARAASVAQVGLVPAMGFRPSAALALLLGMVIAAAVTRGRVIPTSVNARRRRPSRDIHQSFLEDPVTGSGTALAGRDVVRNPPVEARRLAKDVEGDHIKQHRSRN